MEVSWTLMCAGACAPITGDAPHESDEVYMLPPNASCTLEMIDSYGDGWNDAEFTAPGWLGEGVAYSLADGPSGTQVLTLTLALTLTLTTRY